MTPKEFAAYIRMKVGKNSTSFPDDKLILYANTIKEDIAKKVKEADEDYFIFKFTRNLEEGKRNYGLPDTLLEQFKGISVKLDGINEIFLTQTDMSLLKIPYDETSITNYFKGWTPAYDIMGNEIWILSGEAIMAVTDGITIFGADYPGDITDLTGEADMSIGTETSCGMPRALHRVWAKMVISEYKTDNKITLLKTDDPEYLDNKLQEAIDSLQRMDQDDDFVPSFPIEDDGQDY